tara:strand:+ start:7905 stop:8993 length:1089 start_codon:yes stop_codon:yes gene_type:complete
MAKFLNKKEQVYDFKLSSYGRYLLSIGKFKPTYYAFFDDNIIYDITYTDADAAASFPSVGLREGQNNINPRIKEQTPYLESQVLFRDVEDTLSSLEVTTLGFESDITPMMQEPARDILKFESAIGDAFLDGDTQAAPAWKLLMLQGNLSSSIYRQGGSLQPAFAGEARDGIILHSQIPQINLTASYVLKVADSDAAMEAALNPSDVRDVLASTSTPFGDNKAIQLEMVDPLIYIEELNTQLLTENFDIEIFKISSGSLNGNYDPTLTRKYFERKIPQIENGFMLMGAPLDNEEQNLTTASVEYYFDVLRDVSVDQTIACQGLETFNKKGYYIDLDFNCETEPGEAVFYDIYGSVTEPEICQD